MFLFGGNKLKVRSEEGEDGVKTFVEYYRIRQKVVFKVKVLNELMQENFCLGVLDSQLLCFGDQEKSQITFNEITDYLDSKRVAYKKFEIKKIPELSVFGVTIKKGSEKTDKDYIIGFVLNKDNINTIEEYVSKFNVYYFIDRTGLNEEALLKKLEDNYQDVGEMGKDFYCQTFNNNFNSQLVISSTSEVAAEIKEIVNKCHSEL